MDGAPPIIGRESELARIGRFVEAVPAGPVALLIEGDAGIGKTVLWREACDLAKQCSYRILATNPTEPETGLALIGLVDLLEPILDDLLPALPGPQASALEVALLRSRPKGTAPDWRTVSVAVLSALKVLAKDSAVLIAVDDVPWLDAATARVLQFAFRRLTTEPVGIVATRRATRDEPSPLGLDRSLPEERLDVLRLGPLTVAALHHLLESRLGLTPSRLVLTRVHEASGGNPFFALEISGVLKEQGEPGPGEPLPVPRSLDLLVQDRLARLPARVGELLLATSALSRPTVGLLGRLAGADDRSGRALERAVRAGVLEVQGEEVRFTHPLLASALYAGTPPADRRTLHRRLARAVRDPEERARHLALSAEGPDAPVARALDDAARRARGRGAPHAAAELAELAIALTPTELDEERHRRLVEAADHHFVAGDTERAERLLEEAVSALPGGPARADALWRLATVHYHHDSFPVAADLLAEAADHAGEDRWVRARIEAALSFVWANIGEVDKADVHARAALELAEELQDPELLVRAISGVGFIQFLLGEGIPRSLFERGIALEERTPGVSAELRPRVFFGRLLTWTGELVEARPHLEATYREAMDRGDESGLPIIAYYLCELDCFGGNWQRADELARVALESSEQLGIDTLHCYVLYARALIDALLGRVESARAHAQDELELAQRVGSGPGAMYALSLLAFLELSLSNPAGTAALLQPLTDQLRVVGVREPSVFRFLPDVIEALVGLGRLDEAGELLEPFADRARALDRLWARPLSHRCGGLLLAVRGDTAGALAEFDRALAEHARLSMPFELGRTLLVKGQVERRAKRKRTARESLERAHEIFESLGAPLWAEKTRAELRRVGLRPPAPLALTPTEEQVAHLVAAGHSNREVADALFVSVHTVEANLSRIYRKLGVRSRTELSHILAARDPPPRS